MRKLFLVIAFLISAESATMADIKPIRAATTEQETKEARELTTRLEEIKSIDKRQLNASERKELRQEVREIRQRLRDIGGGVYLSAAALIIIILLLILLL